jgi:Uma2 family endonuclease
MNDDALMNVEQFLPLLNDSVDRELIRGRLREWPRRFHTPTHGVTLTAFCSLLKRWEKSQPRPRPCTHAFGAGFLIRRNPDTLIGSDLSIASVEQMAVTPRDQFYFEGPPILAVEILEPWDTHGDIAERVNEYLSAHAIVWVVDAAFGMVTVHRPGFEPETFNKSQELSADPYLPGFRVAVASIFDD